MDGLNDMTLEKFKLWSTPALKVFLAARKKSVEGNFEELSARAFCAWEEKVPVDISAVQAEQQLLGEYKSKLMVNGDVIPDPFSLKEGWRGEKAGILQWPSIYITDIATYLNHKTPKEILHRLMNEYKEGKAYRYFCSDWVKEISLHNIRENSPVCILKAKVAPSQAINNKPYDVWVVVKKDTDMEPGGEVLSGYCSCTAGMLASCNHIAGILFRVEHAVKTGVTKVSSTSMTCSWNVPSTNTSIQLLPVSEAVWKKGHYQNVVNVAQEKVNMQGKQKFTPLTEEQYQKVQKTACMQKELYQLISKDAPNSCFSLLMEKRRPTNSECEVKLPFSLIETAEELKADGAGEEDIQKLFMNKISLTDKNVDDLNKATENQGSSEVWKKHRKGRLTASLFHRICCRVKTLKSDPSTDPTALIQTVMGYKECRPNKAMKHGISLEAHAKKVYRQTIRSKHKHFKCNNSGLFVFRELPFISVSADLVVECDCCGSGLCEIKCPESIKDQVPTTSNVPYIDQNITGMSLQRSHPYFFQIQGQMGVMKKVYCDLFIFTYHGSLTIRVNFDEQFWNYMLQELTWFWKTHIQWELLKCEPLFNINVKAATDATGNVAVLVKDSTLSQNIKPPSVLLPIKRRCGLQQSPVYLCGVCGKDVIDNPQNDEEASVNCDGCNIWVHFVCAGFTKGRCPEDNDEWFCTKCSDMRPET